MGISRRKYLTIMLAVTATVGLLWFTFFLALQPEENYSRIEEHLYLGGALTSPPRGTRAVINLCELEDPYRCDFHYWKPIADSEPAPDLEWLRRIVDILDAQQRNGMTTYVHCRNGVSRRGMLVVAYEMRKNNWTRDEALEFVRSKRPIVRPNPAFMRRLFEWERVMKDDSITSFSSTSAR